jgi:phosphoribosylglycinamide formyltransferase-1
LSEKPVKILTLVSGNGSNLQALIDAEKKGGLEGGTIAGVVSDSPGIYALERARFAGIPAYTELPVLSEGKFQRNLSDRILGIARRENAGLIILAGFLSILAGELLEVYEGKIINLHPSLLPKFAGEGMKGEAVHRAVLAAGETESGCTVHLVDKGIDTGAILLRRAVPVLPGDTPHSLADRIHQEEHIALVEAASMMIYRLRRT